MTQTPFGSSFFRASVAILLVLILHGILLLIDGYDINQVDTLMHFLGGGAVGILGLTLHHWGTGTTLTKPLPLWYQYVFVVGFVMLIGIAWEFHEFVLDRTINIWNNWPKSQLSLADTMKDFLMDWLGASAAFIGFQNRS